MKRYLRFLKNYREKYIGWNNNKVPADVVKFSKGMIIAVTAIIIPRMACRVGQGLQRLQRDIVLFVIHVDLSVVHASSSKFKKKSCRITDVEI